MEKILWYITAASALCTVSSLTVRHYHFIYEPKNWTEAQSYCRENYTDLVTVNNADVMTTLNKMVNLKQLDSSSTAWIGLHFDVFTWNWSSIHEDFSQTYVSKFLNWGFGQPKIPWYEPACGMMHSSGYWHDHYCDKLLTPVCSNVTGQNVEFVLIDTEMSWMQAQSYCREHFTDLAISRNLSENAKIRAVIPAGVYSWIGLFRITWKWSGGPMYVFRSWMFAEPNGGAQKCAAAKFDRSGNWGDWPCDVKKSFICHHDSVPFTKQVVKVKLVGNSALDLNDPAVLENLQEELKQKMREKGVDAEIRLSWKKQVDGKIFYKEKEEDQK